MRWPWEWGRRADVTEAGAGEAGDSSRGPAGASAADTAGIRLVIGWQFGRRGRTAADAEQPARLGLTATRPAQPRRHSAVRRATGRLSHLADHTAEPGFPCSVGPPGRSGRSERRRRRTGLFGRRAEHVRRGPRAARPGPSCREAGAGRAAKSRRAAPRPHADGCRRPSGGHVLVLAGRRLADRFVAA